MSFTETGWTEPLDATARLEAVARCARRFLSDENLGDTTERILTVLAVATEGREGRDYGCAYPENPEYPDPIVDEAWLESEAEL